MRRMVRARSNSVTISNVAPFHSPESKAGSPGGERVCKWYSVVRYGRVAQLVRALP